MPGKRFLFETAPLRFFIFLFFAGIAAISIGFVVMWLWNAILPDLVGVQKIGYWQSVGLLVLCRILFGSFRGGGRRKPWGPPPHFRAKFMNMTEEEKQAFKEEMKKRCASR